MDLLPYKPDMAPDMASAYNTIIRPVPHCYPVSAERFASVTAAAAEGGSSDKLLRDERAFVAAQGRSILGFVHVAIGRRNADDPDEHGLIYFLWYQPGQRRAGRALLSAAHQYVQQQGMCDVIAFSQWRRYPFYYLPSAYLSDRLGHVGALLGMDGYQRLGGEVYMDWPDYPALEPAPLEVEVDISLEWRPARSERSGGGVHPSPGKRPGLYVHAHQGKDHVGICQCVSCGDYSGASEAQDWSFTKWIGISEHVQGQGLGRHLLQRALLELRSAGYRHAAISTARDNYRAALFYTNLGYQVIDWTYAYGRQIE